MKKVFIFTLLAVLGTTQMVAQEYEYVPFVREGVKWVYFYENTECESFPADPNLAIGKVYLTLEIKSDTLIGDKTYKAVHKYYGDAINENSDTVPIFLREENKIVYGIVLNGKTYYDCPIGSLDYSTFEHITNGEEFILYDFQDPVGYWENVFNIYDDDDMNPYEPLFIDTIPIGGHLSKRYVGKKHQIEFYMIEGIGVDSQSSGYTLFPFRPMFTGGNTLFAFSHVIDDGEIVYKGFYYDQDHQVGVGEVVADQRGPQDGNYYDLMGRAVGKDVPTMPGIYIHNGKKILVR
ncbi:MAG: hypothetical protein IKI10_05855 [Muribaculaceae bacterium]|nr:hypothetical protein [Muribaculaceae bacterium]